MKINNPSERDINNNIKKENVHLENSFMKNIRIDNKRKENIEYKNDVNNTNKKDNKLETIESKKENIMKIPKNFQLKYNNLAEKKNNLNVNINLKINNSNGESLKKITNNISLNESNNLNYDNNNYNNFKNNDFSINKIQESNKISNNIESKENKINQNNLNQIKIINNQLKKTENTENILSQVINRKIDIIENIPLFLNDQGDHNEIFKIVDVVSNYSNDTNNQKIENKYNENSVSHSEKIDINNNENIRKEIKVKGKIILKVKYIIIFKKQNKK